MTGSRIYLDTCLVVYFVEEHPRYVSTLIKAMESRVTTLFCISPLVILECLVVPLRERNQFLIERYEMFFQDYICLEINHGIFRNAARLRAEQGLKTPDALHLATARHYECAEFWTNDQRLCAMTNMRIVNILTQTSQSK